MYVTAIASALRDVMIGLHDLTERAERVGVHHLGNVLRRVRNVQVDLIEGAVCIFASFIETNTLLLQDFTFDRERVFQVMLQYAQILMQRPVLVHIHVVHEPNLLRQVRFVPRERSPSPQPVCLIEMCQTVPNTVLKPSFENR